MHIFYKIKTLTLQAGISSGISLSKSLLAQLRCQASRFAKSKISCSAKCYYVLSLTGAAFSTLTTTLA
jgi:hypothetical protein